MSRTAGTCTGDESSTFRLALVLAAFLLVLGGCGETKSPGPSARLTLPIENDIQTLDPALLSDPYTSRIVWQVFEGLVGLDASGQVVPLLAAQWSASPDFTQWRFKVRPNVRFHEHAAFKQPLKTRTVTAADIVYTYHRFAKGFGSFVFAGLVRGFDEYAAGKATAITGFSSPDPETFEIALTRSDPAFLFRITSPYLGIMPREVIEAAPDAFGVEVAIGTGPFRLVERKPTEVVLERFAGYWRATKGNVRTIVFRVEKNSQFRLTQFEDGRYDLVDLPVTSLSKYFEGGTLRGDQAKRFEAYTARTFNVHYLGIDNRQVTDVHLRRAIAHAVDKKAIVTSLLHGMADIATSPVPPGLQGFRPPPDVVYDPVAARREAGLAVRSRRPLVILASDAPNAVQIAQVVRQNLADVAIPAEVERVDFNTLISRLFGKARPPLFLIFSEWIYGAPELIVESFNSQRFPNPNAVGFANPQVDERLALLPTLRDRAQINKQCEEIAALANADVPAVWLYHQRNVFLLNRKLRGFAINGHQYWGLADVTVDGR